MDEGVLTASNNTENGSTSGPLSLQSRHKLCSPGGRRRRSAGE